MEKFDLSLLFWKLNYKDPSINRIKIQKEEVAPRDAFKNRIDDLNIFLCLIKEINYEIY